MDLMFDWEYEGDRFSFEDSDRFEEDSLCSWLSEPESLCNNWRGWKRQNGGQTVPSIRAQESKVTPLVELAAQAVACHIPFEVVEHFPQPIPEQLQLRIAFWSFPENEEDIRLYSCLANGSADEFTKGEHLYKSKAVRDALQIGFHLSATVIHLNLTQTQGKGSYNVAVVFDRRRISSCTCTCNSSPSWCSHIVALCLYRIHQATSVCLRAPVSESLSRLHRDQLQKFAQYLITELPQQILPTAQRLLDELLSSQETAINTVYGAPDPTAGPPASEQTSWCLDETTLHENVKKTLVKFCVPSPIVFSDVNYLSASAPPAAAEWQSLLRPLRGREPEGMWNLLSIVREMFKRHDSNSVPLLEILTDEVLQCEQILIWWFATKASASNNSNAVHCSRSGNSSANATQHAAASLCEEIVTLWRLAALNPKLSPIQADDLCTKFKEWHIQTIEKVRKARGSNSSSSGGNIKKSDIENFPGFKPAIEACQMTWEDYPIPGVTYSDKDGSRYVYHFSSKGSDGEGKKPSRVQPVTICSEDIISTDNSRTLAHSQRSQDARARARHEGRPLNMRRDSAINDGAASSGSEGFCEPERGFRDSDSSYDNKGFHSRSNSLDEPDPGHVYPGQVSHRENVRVMVHQDSDVFDDGVVDDRPDPVGQDLANPTPQEEGAMVSPGATAQSSQSLEAGAPAVRPVEQSTSESQQSSDEYQMYFYDPKSKLTDADKKKKDKNEEPNYFAGLKNPQEASKVPEKNPSSQDNFQASAPLSQILFARAEALHAHGHTKEACKLAKQLAEDLLTNPPDLIAESANVPTPKSKKKKALNNISLLASATLSKASFLVSVLCEGVECHHLAFQVGMFGLELARPPASSKALEVKLAHQESELLQMLKKIPLWPAELGVLRDRAEQLRDGKLQTRGDALLPLHLATFIFDSLCLPGVVANRSVADEKLGFEAAVTALGLKANVSEAEHPLLCESTRRQRGELAMSMLVQYKDDQVKLSKIMDKLLDKEVHQLFKAPSLVTYLSSSKTSSSQGPIPGPSHAAAQGDMHGAVGNMAANHNSDMDNLFVPDRAPMMGGGNPDIGGQWQDVRPGPSGGADALPPQHPSHSGSGMITGGARPKTYTHRYNMNSGKDTDSSALEEEGDDIKALEAKIRCLGMKKKPSQGMASIDSSAPETTSSDNSPTLVRRNFGKHQGPGSDCGSSGDSSDSLGSSSSGDKGARGLQRDNESPPSPYINRILPSQLMMDSRSSTPNIKGIRYKGKNRIMPTVPNQPSEASAHFMFELAKTVLMKAGGNSSTSLFTQPSNSNNQHGPHRNLHLCAFQIGLYALGLSNCVAPNWLSRTYSSHVSWITGQAMEIGSAAIRILIDTWEGHLTPPEVASLADRAARGRDPNMAKTAAELALSCLPHAHALNPTEVQRALFQCKEQSQEMLEKACLAVETAAEGGGVFPEVLFDVARHWHELSEEAAQKSSSEAVDVCASAARTVRVEPENQAPVAVPVVAAPVQPVANNPDRNSPSAHPVLPYNHNPPQSQANATASPQLLTHSSNPVAHQAVVLSPYAIPQTGPHHAQLPQAYVQHYNNCYVQQVPAAAFSHYSQPHIVHPHSIHPAYVTQYYQNQAPYGNIQNMSGHSQVYHTSATHIRPITPAVPIYAGTNCQVATVQNISNPISSHIHGLHQLEPTTSTASTGTMGQIAVASPQPAAQPPVHNQEQLKYLMAAFRVGMSAMETLARRVHDDRPQTKYARNPPYGEDVKWLLAIAIKLGTSTLQQFCASAVNAVVSPFVLYDLASEAARFLARNNQAHVPSQLRSNILNSMFQKCLQMFIQCAHQRIHHITYADYDDFVSTICSARNAFFMAPGGVVQFNELLQSLRRSKSCRKDLWQKIMGGLATGSV
ncbi:zinc finger SWIM domain-containing protein 8 homolog isoform X2 [Haliotis rufescens]|uniref:zinc finger SWIM domain-containing protein 8 homolog isoform X2 n=1 Tax=Haliotis rufescens TaxID=6454 RepID=UPI001EB0A969|nr:zinc finger SWIM domain-containing protein 8 homolog isoform X2 [Haliotis rufescens]